MSSNTEIKTTKFQSIKLFGRKLINSRSFDNTTSTSVKVPKLKKKNTSPGEELKTRTPVRSSTSAKLLSRNNTNPFTLKNNSTTNGTSTPLTRDSSLNTIDKPLIYNPYGTNTSSNHYNTTKPDATFYLHDGSTKQRVLSLPLRDPNEMLPDEFKQISVQLFDNFKFENDTNIGNGGTSEVKKISNVNGAKIYAFKRLNMIYDENDETYYKRCSREFIIAKYLNDENLKLQNNKDFNKYNGGIHIVGVYDLLKVPTTTFMCRGWGYVMELGKCDLFHLISKSGWKNVHLNEKYCIFKQICLGIKFMHDKGIAHRDIKPENILFDYDGVVKITDFGISNWLYNEPRDFESGIKLFAGMIGSPPYTAPEVMMYDAKKNYSVDLQKPYDARLMDSYALGILLMVMVSNGLQPFMESCSKDSKFRDYENGYNNFIKYNNKNFRTKGNYRPGPGSEYQFAKIFKDSESSRACWRLADPVASTRYTMDDLLEDPWFTKIETCISMEDTYDNLFTNAIPEIKPPTITPPMSPSTNNNNGTEQEISRSMCDFSTPDDTKTTVSFSSGASSSMLLTLEERNEALESIVPLNEISKKSSTMISRHSSITRRTSTPRRTTSGQKKKLVHDHLNVVSSVTNLLESTKNSSLASSIGSASFKSRR
ncbi:hypothetical protein KAFR_0E00330 [Kazachstania africana CBS 2517]|uniref:non-specific serine/threonine protein kinase n=1 Tax=Kazachstania africana (strain ATCC 22294 / BCRC 22015 / CBS 2517 / CECT 1963 / NBRC 1671 / NRRL Y-8276) TaxID=1071382 RepID=H2AUY7_KAZAF|nr:hypothetical protein KAFR_0E00330 [Kazachstania africana CBS 2517]CCF58187.1 hypothetical protein KAFR_0E00330 [Kazachstania africana CBS 2517]